MGTVPGSHARRDESPRDELVQRRSASAGYAARRRAIPLS